MHKTRENFVRLAQTRTNRLLKGMDILGNLSNRNNYLYDQEDIRKIFGSLKAKLKLVEGRFLTEQAKEKGLEFKLDE